jgi:hypothetical protein
VLRLRNDYLDEAFAILAGLVGGSLDVDTPKVFTKIFVGAPGLSPVALADGAVVGSQLSRIKIGI